MTAEPVAWDGTDAHIGRLPHRTPLTLEGHIQAGTRDATFLTNPDVRTIKARHILVASHTYEVGGGIHAPAAACDPGRVMLDDSTLVNAQDVHLNGRCRRRGCQRLYALADQRAADAAAEAS